MIVTCTRSIGFDAGHRVVNHESKCRTLHGHRYTAEITCYGQLDTLGRVIDFSKIKEVVGAWIDEQWDHAMILYRNDPDLEKLQSCSGYKPVFVMDANPTAENMAALLMRVAEGLLMPYDIKVNKVKLWETPNCFVEAACTE